MADFKKLTKKIFCLSLSAVLAGGGMAVALPQMIDGGITAEAASDRTTTDGFEWEENHDGSVTITNYTGNGGEVVIPSEIDGKSVTSIGDWAFEDCTGLTSVTIGKGVTSIGGFAFEGCTGLTSVTIGKGVTSIGDYAFCDCTGLTSVAIPESVTLISVWAFEDCTGLKVISVDKNNKSYTSEDGVLFDKNKTTLITYPGGKKGVYTIPNSVTSIGDWAFEDCTGLTNITIPDSVTEIGYSAFAGCTGLTSIKIPDSVTSIGGNAFYGCTELTSVTIPDSVTEIGYSAFEGCTGLTSVTIGKGVTSIGDLAFEDCTGLTSVTIPDSVTSIGYSAFFGCTGLTVISVDKNSESYTSEDGVLFDKNKTTLITYPGGKKGAYTIPDSVTSIGNSAFSYCTGLTNVTIPDSVMEIGYSAFAGCTGLTSVTIPDSVTEIGGCAFSSCTGLTSVTIPDSVTEIGWCAFSSCTGLTSVIIPDSVTSIGDYAFDGCKELTIYGKKGSCAEQYAKDNNIPFKVVVDISVTGIKLSQTSITLEKGKTQTITATVSPSNATNKTVTWTTSNSSVATVSNGKITAKGAGTATITAKTANGKTATCKVTVKNPTVAPTSIKLSKTSITLEKGKTQTITATVSPSNATDKTVTWTTSNSSVATVSKGKITAKGAGTATIMAKTANGKSATCKVTVKNPTVNVTGIKLNTTRTWLGRGESYQLNATVSPSNATNKKITWTSSNNSIATVSNGKVTAKKDGTVTITAKTSNGKTATCKITVQPPASKISLNKSTLYLGVGEKFQLTSSVQSGTASAKRGFSSSNNNICYTSGSGQLTAKKTGTAYITVKTFNGKTAQCKVVVQPPAKAVHISKSWLTLHVGQKFQLSSWVDAGTASTKRAWSSSDNSTVYTSGSGLLTAKKEGTAYITVKTFNGVSSTLKVKVIK